MVTITEQWGLFVKGQHIIKVIGIIACLIGATLMLKGNVFGERTTGIATIVGIAGIGLISTSARKLRS